MKRITFKIILPLLTLVIIGYACSQSFLTINPPAVLSTQVLSNKVGVEAILVGAYSPYWMALAEMVAQMGPGQLQQVTGYMALSACGDGHKGSDPGDHKTQLRQLKPGKSMHQMDILATFGSQI
jgi:hypothetical protein